jgi:starch-binding outer membrane protein, SusD/RagB family
MKRRFTFTITIALAWSLLSECKKLVQVTAPVTNINSANVYAEDATAAAVLTGIYTDMSNSPLGGNTVNSFMSFFPGLSADEYTLQNTTDEGYTVVFDNTLAATNAPDFWTTTYTYIYTCNAALEGLAVSTALTASVKQELIGEAYFIRALNYFYLTNLYGDVPLALSTDYTINATLGSAPQTQVYQQVIADLFTAQSMLSVNYLDGTIKETTINRVRPTQWAATALLARAYLYAGNYDSAFIQSSRVIANTSLFSLDSLNAVFLANSTETIWSLQPVKTEPTTNTMDAYLFIIPSTGPSDQWPISLSTQLLDAFETGDRRRIEWVDSVIVNGIIYFFPYKYQNNTDGQITEYEMQLRLGEQYLIRAEAQANGAGFGTFGAINDLNIIRNRAQLPNYNPVVNGSLTDAILHERQVELFSEWGHRWFDLKRTKNIDSVMTNVTPLKGGQPWQTFQQLYPLPIYDLQTDQYLVQNSGY